VPIVGAADQGYVGRRCRTAVGEPDVVVELDEASLVTPPAV
jgi:hypothetical protein